MSSSKVASSSNEVVKPPYIRASRQDVLDYVKLKRIGHPVGSLRDYIGGIPDLCSIDLSNVNLSGGDFSGALVHGADLRGADARNACFSGVDLKGADLRQTNFSHCDMQAVSLQGCDARTANFAHADLRWASLLWVNLGNNSTLEHTNFAGAATFNDYSHAPLGTKEIGRKPNDLAVLDFKDTDMPYHAILRYEQVFTILLDEGVKFDQRMSDALSNSLADKLKEIQAVKATYQTNFQHLSRLRGMLQIYSQGAGSQDLADDQSGKGLPMEVLLMIGEYMIGNDLQPEARRRLLNYGLDREALKKENSLDQQSFVGRVIEGRSVIRPQQGATHQDRLQQSAAASSSVEIVR